MSKFRLFAAVTAMLISAFPSRPVAAQSLEHEEIDFTISAPFKLRRSSVELPAGNYILKELAPGDFGLYVENLRRAPVAMISTIPIYQRTGSPLEEGTHILLDRTNPPEGEDPILDGWTVPGGEGWQVLGVVADVKRLEAMSAERHPPDQHGAQ